MRIYGPYLRKDGRKHIIKIDETGKRKTQSYPRFLMEKILDQELLPSEEVDHRDDDYTNDSIYNLQVLPKIENHYKELNRPKRQAKWFEGNCPECNNFFSKRMKEASRLWREERAGPFCSRSCAGKHNQKINGSGITPF